MTFNNVLKALGFAGLLAAVVAPGDWRQDDYL